MSDCDEDVEDLNNIRNVLLSLVACSKNITVLELLKKYRNLHGYVPIQRYGYQNIHRFMWEQFNNWFIFQGPYWNPVVTLKQPFVKISEKQNTGTSPNIPSTSRWPQQDSNAPSTSNENSPSTSRKAHASTYRNNTTTGAQTQSRLVKRKVHASTYRNNTTTGAQTQSGLLETEPDWFDSDEGSDKELFKVGPDGKETCDPIQLKRTMKKLNNAMLRSRWKQEEPLRDVRALLLRYPEGVWCSQLMQLFREYYGRELYYDYYYTVTRLVKRVPNVKVTYYPDRGDFLIIDEKRAVHYVPTDKVAVYPLDCMQRRDRIYPAFTAAKLNVGETLDVAVEEIYSPSIFWVRRFDDIDFGMLGGHMNLYYMEEAQVYNRRLHPQAVREGYYCASRQHNEWRRSRIIKVYRDEDTDEPLRVKVRLVDYGSVEMCSARELWPLPLEFARVGSQATRARLAGVRPVASELVWPHDANKRFREVVRRSMYSSATVTARDLSELTLELRLMQKVAGELVSVADELVREGHADPRSEPAIQMKEYYLYPSFSSLEGGKTLSFQEISELLRDGEHPSAIEEYRRYMPDIQWPQNERFRYAPPLMDYLRDQALKRWRAEHGYFTISEY